MGLISKLVRGAKPKNRRVKETRQAPPPNRNRRQGGRKKIVDFSFKIPWFGRFLNWAGTVLLSLAVVGCITVGLLYGYRYITNTGYFRVKSLEVEGNFRLTSREILEIADLQIGMNALLVSIDAVERAIVKSPWVAAASVKRVLPDGFVIRILEREPRFWVRHDGTLFYADAKGRPIVAVSPGRFASFPTLEVEAGAEDLMDRLPELLASLAGSTMAIDVAAVSLVRLSPGRGVEVYLESSSLLLSIGQEEWADNLMRLSVTLADLARRKEMRGVREVRAHGAGVWVIKNRPVVTG